jgi:uncharacterized protein (TIGR02266 family)
LGAIVFPVRYVADGVASQSTSRELSELGIEVRTLAPPPIGVRVSMALYLPGGGPPEIAIGRVADARTGERGPAGFWADFLVVDPEARMRITRVLIGRPPGDLRTFRRHPVRFKVKFGRGGELVRESATNLSRAGVFICTDAPPPLMEGVSVQLELPDGGGPIFGAGIVVHRVTAEQAAQGGPAAGAGVQFVDATDEFRERIDRYLASLPE